MISAFRKKLTHLDTTAAINVLREYTTLLDLTGECAMSLQVLAWMQRQIISERTKAIYLLPTIYYEFNVSIQI